MEVRNGFILGREMLCAAQNIVSRMKIMLSTQNIVICYLKVSQKNKNLQ